MSTSSSIFLQIVLVGLSFLYSTQGAYAAPLFADDFTSGASPLWGNEVGNWTDTGGVYRASVPDNVPNAYSSLPYDLTDFTVEVDVNNVADGGVWLRSAPAPGTTVGVQGVLLVTLGSSLYWHVVTDGSTYGASLNPVNGGYAPGSNPKLRIEVMDDTYSVFANGSVAPITSVSSGLFSSGQLALYDNSSSQTFDNVVVNAIPEPSTTLIAGLATAFLVITHLSKQRSC